MDCRITDGKIAFRVNNVVNVPRNHFDDDRTEPFYGVVDCLIHDNQARIKLCIFWPLIQKLRC